MIRGYATKTVLTNELFEETFCVFLVAISVPSYNVIINEIPVSKTRLEALKEQLLIFHDMNLKQMLCLVQNLI